MPLKKLINLTNITLLVALALSSVAAYYSIIGLTAIFAGAVIPVIVMGSILEVGKITTTVWLRKYWNQCSWVLKLYLVPAVIALAILTSMGIFGFLSKAHMDSGLVSGDVTAKLSLIDEKIKTQRDNIEIARKALQQMDAQVDARLSRGESEQGAERAVQIRRQQAGERAKLQKEIGEAQKVIAQLNEERAPIAAENRKVEAEVGPIKYVAALLYGDNPDINTLERAVRWVIILLVIVFDPLAIALVLAANSSKEWDQKMDDVAAMNINPEPEGVTIRPFTEEEMKAMDDANKPVEAPWPTEWTDSDVDKLAEETFKDIEKEEAKSEDIPHRPDTHPYLNQGFKYPEGWEFVPPMVHKPEEEKVDEKAVEEQVNNIEKKLAILSAIHHPEEVKEQPLVVTNSDPKDNAPLSVEPTADSNEIITEGVTNEHPWEELQDGFVKYDGKVLQKDALKRINPNLFLKADTGNTIKTNFGTQFPKLANKGDVFVRVDALPNRVFKFEGSKWIEINKDLSSSYLNDDYVQFLINKIYTGEYDLETLSESEKSQIEAFLKNQKS